MTVTIYEYEPIANAPTKYKLCIRDNKNNLVFKTNDYSQLYFMINKVIKFPYYDKRTEKRHYNYYGERTATQTIYYSEGGMF